MLGGELGTLSPMVGSKNAGAFLQIRCGPGGEKAGWELLHILFKKTAWMSNGSQGSARSDMLKNQGPEQSSSRRRTGSLQPSSK